MEYGFEKLPKIVEGNLKKLKSLKSISRFFSKTNLRYFVINFDEKMFGYKINEKDATFNVQFSLNEIRALRETIDSHKQSQCDWKYGFELEVANNIYTLFAVDLPNYNKWISAFNRIIKKDNIEYLQEDMGETIFEMALNKFYYPYLEELAENRKKTKNSLLMRRKMNQKKTENIFKILNLFKEEKLGKLGKYDKYVDNLIKEADSNVDSIIEDFNQLEAYLSKKSNRLEKDPKSSIIENNLRRESNNKMIALPPETGYNKNKNMNKPNFYNNINNSKPLTKGIKIVDSEDDDESELAVKPSYRYQNLFDSGVEGIEENLKIKSNNKTKSPLQKNSSKNRFGQVKPEDLEDKNINSRFGQVKPNTTSTNTNFETNRYGQVHSNNYQNKIYTKAIVKSPEKINQISMKNNEFKYIASHTINPKRSVNIDSNINIQNNLSNKNSKNIKINFNYDDLLDWNIYDDNFRILDKSKLNSIKKIFNKDIPEEKNFQIENVTKLRIRPDPKRELNIEELHLKAGSPDVPVTPKEDSKYFKVSGKTREIGTDFKSSLLKAKQFLFEEKLESTEIKPSTADNFSLDSKKKYAHLQIQNLNSMSVEKKKEKKLILTNNPVNYDSDPDFKNEVEYYTNKINSLNLEKHNPKKINNKPNKEIFYDVEKNEIYYGANVIDKSKQIQNEEKFFKKGTEMEQGISNSTRTVDKNLIKGEIIPDENFIQNYEKFKNIHNLLNERLNQTNQFKSQKDGPYARKSVVIPKK